MPVMDVKESIRERDGYRCVDCGRTQRGRRLDVHRIVPGRLGGEYTAKNCVTLCRRCHRKRHGESDPYRQKKVRAERKQMWIPVALYERLDRIAFHEQRPTSWQGEIAIAASVSEIEKAKGLPPIADDEAWREEKERRQREGR